MTGPPIEAMPGTCSVKFEHMDGWVTNEYTTAGNLASGMTIIMIDIITMLIYQGVRATKLSQRNMIPM